MVVPMHENLTRSAGAGAGAANSDRIPLASSWCGTKEVEIDHNQQHQHQQDPAAAPPTGGSHPAALALVVGTVVVQDPVPLVHAPSRAFLSECVLNPCVPYPQINLQFDPVIFEDPAYGVRVHRGVYE
eukprot:scaffold219182_cov37-Tisochrysis_lutea.AAC.1